MAAFPFPARRAALALAAAGVTLLAACDDDGNLDLDLRGLSGGFDTSDAASNPTNRPAPDNRGVISYPDYQVVVASQGETVRQIAGRLNLDATALARHNGIDPDVPLRRDEIVALPTRVSEPSPATGAVTTGPIQPPAQIDITTLAGDAIDNAGPQQPVAQPATSTTPSTSAQPVQHQVQRGETAYSIARLYNVPVRSLGEWNGLGTDLAVREGQQLMIPVAGVAPPSGSNTNLPGTGTPTPTPPSATQPLPDEDATPDAPQEVAETPPAPDLGTPSSNPATSAPFIAPVSGSVAREYNPPRNEGIDFTASAGTDVRAAADGTIAAVSETASGEQFVVMRHTGTILSVYMNLGGLNVERGDTVSQGQTLGQVSDAGFLHFEVRDGRDSVDPADFLP